MTPPKKGKNRRLLIRRKDLAAYLQLDDSDIPADRLTFTIQEVAKLSGRSPEALYQDIRKGRLVAIKI